MIGPSDVKGERMGLSPLAVELMKAFIAQGLDEGSGPHSAFVQAAVEAAMKVFSRHNQELADEFRRLAAEAWGKTEDVPANGGLSAEDAVHHDATAQAFTQAAQMVEEKLNG